MKCFDPKESLNFRVTVLCHNNNELVNILLTPVEQTEGMFPVTYMCMIIVWMFITMNLLK